MNHHFDSSLVRGFNRSLVWVFEIILLGGGGYSYDLSSNDKRIAKDFFKNCHGFIWNIFMSTAT